MKQLAAPVMQPRRCATAPLTRGPVAFGARSRLRPTVCTRAASSDAAPLAMTATGMASAWTWQHGPQKLLLHAKTSARLFADSIHQGLLEAIAEDIEQWDATRICSTLLLLAFLQRRPNDEWLQRFWPASQAALGSCTIEQLSMLSYGLTELELQPPATWQHALLASVLSAARQGQGMEGTEPSPAAPTSPTPAAANQQQPMPAAVRMRGMGLAGRILSFAPVRLAQQPGAGALSPSWRPSLPGAWPLQELQQLVARTQRHWSESRCGAELVTVLYNLSVAGVAMDGTWLDGVMEALLPRLRHLSGEDLECLLCCLAERGATLRRPWLAACYARIDQINWALQGQNLVGCLVSLAQLGQRPPTPWLQRQLCLQLQPALPLLPTPSLVELCMVMPSLLQLQPADEPWLQRWAAECAAIAQERLTQMATCDLLYMVVGLESLAYRLPDGWRGQMLAELAARLPAATPPQLAELWQALAQVRVEGLAPLKEAVAEGLNHVQGSQLDTSDIAPMLSALAASGLPPPHATLKALLTASQNLLLACHSNELVAVATALLQLNHKPSYEWQVAFFSASRRRLGLMDGPQLAALLVACASLSLHPPEPWLRDHCALTCQKMDELGGVQLASLAWAVSCTMPEPGRPWLAAMEAASAPQLRALGPNMLAVVLKALATLHHRPGAAWQAAYYNALHVRLFASGAALISYQEDADEVASELLHAAPPSPEEEEAAAGAAAAASATAAVAASAAMPPTTPLPGAASSSKSHRAPAAGTIPSSPSSSLPSASVYSLSSLDLPPLHQVQLQQQQRLAMLRNHSSPPYSTTSRPATSHTHGTPPMALPHSSVLSPAITPDTLNSLVYSLASLDLAPPAAVLNELMDGVRCKLSLLSTLDLNVVLAYLVARQHRPSDEWWEDFLAVFEERFTRLSSGELCSLLVMLNALRVSPSAHWLDAFCAATSVRLSYFEPSHLLQVLSCLHLFHHRPSQSWMHAYNQAVEGSLPRFSPTELARVLMLLDHLNQRPSDGFMLQFFNASRLSLAQLEAQELANVAWAVVSCSMLSPDYRWVDALVAAARPRVAAMAQQQLRVFIAALGHMQRSVDVPEASDCLAFAKEFLE